MKLNNDYITLHNDYMKHRIDKTMHRIGNIMHHIDNIMHDNEDMKLNNDSFMHESVTDTLKGGNLLACSLTDLLTLASYQLVSGSFAFDRDSISG